MLDGAARLKPIVGKSLKSFRKTTADRLKTKASVGLWRGFDKKLPAVRREEGSRLPAMVGAPKPRLSSNLLATSRIAFAASQGKGGGPGVAGQRGVASEAAAAAQVITVAEDLPKATLSADVLMNWLPAIACGKTVEVKQSKTRISLKAAIGISAAVQLSSEFAVKHKGLTLQLRKIMMQPSSKWHEVATGGVAIRDLHSFRSFLVRMQRRPLLCGVSVPLAKPLAILGGVSRYGRPVVA